jgi:UMF1 family MFS transporter
MFKLKAFDHLERSWILYDIANSAYILIVVTVLFPLYYGDTQSLAFATAGIALTDALLSPIIGGLTNYSGNKKKFFKLFFFIAVIGTLALIIPGLSQVALLVFFIISSIGYGLSNVVYDSFIIDVTSEERMDKVSSAGYAWGYIGSMIPFVVAIIPYGLINVGLLDESYTYVSIVFAFIIALSWWYYFSLPLLRDVNQTYNVEHVSNPISTSLKSLFHTFKDISKYKNIFLFMLAYLFYIDVVNTVIRLATTIGSDLEVSNIVLLGVVMLVQVVAFPAAIIYGNLTRKFGGKVMIFFGIFIYAIAIIITSFISAETAYLMWVVGFIVGLAQGGIQSISRSFFAKMLPKEKSNQFFGFFSVFGKFSGIISPFLFAVALNSLTTNQAVLILFIPLTIGAIIFSFVKDSSHKNKKELQ